MANTIGDVLKLWEVKIADTTVLDDFRNYHQTPDLACLGTTGHSENLLKIPADPSGLNSNRKRCQAFNLISAAGVVASAADYLDDIEQRLRPRFFTETLLWLRPQNAKGRFPELKGPCGEDVAELAESKMLEYLNKHTRDIEQVFVKRFKVNWPSYARMAYVTHQNGAAWAKDERRLAQIVVAPEVSEKILILPLSVRDSNPRLPCDYELVEDDDSEEVRSSLKVFIEDGMSLTDALSAARAFARSN